MNFFDSLLTQSSQSQVHPELLETLGRQAAQMFKRGVALNEAISKLVSEHPELGNEHIKRVVEFANNVTFQELFENSSDKNVHFEVADPGVVLRDVKDGGSPAHDGKTMQGGMGDYKTAPQSSGTDPELDQALFSQFNTVNPEESAHTKLASADHNRQHANPIEDLYDTHVRLQATRTKIAESHEQFDLLLKEAREDLYQIVKREVLADYGSGLGGVLGALEKIASKDDIAAVLAPMVERLAGEVISGRRLSLSMEKRAGTMVNINHPLVRTWSGMMKTANEVVRSQEALAEVESHIRKTSGALTTAVKKSVGGKLNPAVRQRFSTRK